MDQRKKDLTYYRAGRSEKNAGNGQTENFLFLVSRQDTNSVRAKSKEWASHLTELRGNKQLAFHR
jgi:hypothetical protein